MLSIHEYPATTARAANPHTSPADGGKDGITVASFEEGSAFSSASKDLDSFLEAVGLGIGQGQQRQKSDVQDEFFQSRILRSQGVYQMGEV